MIPALLISHCPTYEVPKNHNESSSSFFLGCNYLRTAVQCHHTYILYSKRCLAIHLRHKVVPGLHHVEQQGHELELRTHQCDIRNFFYEPFRGQGELLIIETFRPEVLTLGILTVGQAYQEECEIYKASIVLGKLGKGYIIRGILLGGDIRNSRLGMY